MQGETDLLIPSANKSVQELGCHLLRVHNGDSDGTLHIASRVKFNPLTLEARIVVSPPMACRDAKKACPLVRQCGMLWCVFGLHLACGGLGQVYDLGYIGSYRAELEALISIAEDASPPAVMNSILQPRQDFPGDYTDPFGEDAANRIHVPMNAMQRKTVNDLRYSLEKIQGPPGTGKSTTICNIITKRVPSSARILVTCSRNVAVEGLVKKLEPLMSEDLLVVGAKGPRGMGETASR